MDSEGAGEGVSVLGFVFVSLVGLLFLKTFISILCDTTKVVQREIIGRLFLGVAYLSTLTLITHSSFMLLIPRWSKFDRLAPPRSSKKSVKLKPPARKELYLRILGA